VQVDGVSISKKLQLEYFVTFKKVTECYSGIVTHYFYLVTGQVYLKHLSQPLAQSFCQSAELITPPILQYSITVS